jgi:hypothetical protein
MVSSIGGTQAQQLVSSQPPKQTPPAASQAAPQDTVQLSHAAQKALSGDVDHDGDSH